MKNLINPIETFVFQNFAVCFICKVANVKDGPTCSQCFANWNKLRSADCFLNAEKNKVCPIWNWKKNDFSMLDLVEMQKGGFNAIADWLADLMLHKFRSGLDDSRSVFIPVPPTVKGRSDHAHVLAEALSKKTGSEFLPILEKESRIVAKLHSKSDREGLIRVRAIEKISKLHQVILVDDIYTTGATAKACFLALEQPVGLQIWTLAYRHLDDSTMKC